MDIRAAESSEARSRRQADAPDVISFVQKGQGEREMGLPSKFERHGLRGDLRNSNAGKKIRFSYLIQVFCTDLLQTRCSRHKLERRAKRDRNNRKVIGEVPGHKVSAYRP